MMSAIIERRRFLRTALAAGTAVPLLRALPAWAQALSPLSAAARDAWLYGLVLIEMAKSRQEALEKAGVNRLNISTAPTTPDTQSVTTPNNDTLYGRAWIDLSSGPVEIELPETGSRYFSVALMDMYSNNFAVLGTRATGGAGGRFTLVGPYGDSSDPLAIRSPTRWVWLLSRLLFDDEADLPVANRIHAGLTVRGPALPKPPVTASRDAPWSEYFTSVQNLILENPPPATDRRIFASMAPLGLAARGGFSAARFDAAQAHEIEAGVATAKALLSGRRPGHVQNGWIFPKSSLGDFGQDYLFRAQVALGGLAALPPVEAMYLRPVNNTGGMLFDSAEDWKLTLPAHAMPPVDAFWSMTMYRATRDGQYFLINNPINRYAIGNRTKGLTRDADDSLTIWMSRADPGPARRSNWLPLPSEGPFAPVFRAYMPRTELLDQSYPMPALERVDLSRS